MPPIQPEPVPAVRLNRLRKAFGSDVAVHDLTFGVARGEIVTLLGPEGSGKTTTLLMLAGFHRPDGGEVEIEGSRVARTPPRRRGLGVMLQEDRLLPNLSLAENIALPLRLRGQGRGDRAAAVIPLLNRLRLGHLAAHRPAALSACEQRLAMLARALAAGPRIVLLDAPFAGLDRGERTALTAGLREIQAERGFALLLATREAEEALALSDRIALLDQGQLRQLDTPAFLYESPTSAAAARLLGEGNRLAGEIESVEDDIALVRLAGGATVEARLADAAPGLPCVVWVRPERIAVAAVPAEEMGQGALPAMLLASDYAGDHHRLRLRLGLPGSGLTEIIARRPAGAPLPPVGETMSVAWQWQHALAFAAEPAG